MGEHKPNRPARLVAALSVAVAAGALLTSCASLAGAAEPTDSAPVASASASEPATSAPAPEETTVAPQPSSSAEKVEVEPFVTAATWDGQGLDVGAVVPKVVESDGTCTATAERDGVTVTRSGAAAAASSYTGCPQLVLTDQRLEAGTWTVTVSYASADSAGTSKPTTVTIG